MMCQKRSIDVSKYISIFFDSLVIFRHYFTGNGNGSFILATRSDWFVSWFSLVIGQNTSRQLATSSENLVASAQFLVALATSELQFRSLNTDLYSSRESRKTHACVSWTVTGEGSKLNSKATNVKYSLVTQKYFTKLNINRVWELNWAGSHKNTHTTHSTFSIDTFPILPLKLALQTHEELRPTQGQVSSIENNGEDFI